MSWLVHVLGLDNPVGRWELFWSGFGSDISQFALIGTISGATVALYRRHSCHVEVPKFCWRPGTHQLVGTPYRVCKKHHPEVPDQITAEHVQAAHEKTQKGAGDG